jgi:hypothetical protein
MKLLPIGEGVGPEAVPMPPASTLLTLLAHHFPCPSLVGVRACVREAEVVAAVVAVAAVAESPTIRKGDLSYRRALDPTQTRQCP